MNGEGSVRIDRGRWLYRFALNNDNIAIYRTNRSGQHLAADEVWRTLALLGVSDAFVVEGPGGWQPFVELADSGERWSLATRKTLPEAEDEVGYFLVSLANAIAASNALTPESAATGGPLPATPPAPARHPGVEARLADKVAMREAPGWDLIYSRQRASH